MKPVAPIRASSNSRHMYNSVRKTPAQLYLASKVQMVRQPTLEMLAEWKVPVLCLTPRAEEKLPSDSYQHMDLRSQSHELPLQVAQYMLRVRDLFGRTL